MYTHTVYSATGAIISQTQRSEPLNEQPKREYNTLQEQIKAEEWNLHGIELLRRSASAIDLAVFQNM